MIEKMKQVCVVSTSSRTREMLVQLRKLGTVHIRRQKAADVASTQRFSDLTYVMQFLKEQPGASADKPALCESDFEVLDKSVRHAMEEKKRCSDRLATVGKEIEAVSAWGDFRPAEVKALMDSGISLFFYTVSKKDVKALESDGSVRFVRLSQVNGMNAVAVLDQPLGPGFGATRFELPSKGLSELEGERDQMRSELAKADKVILDASKELASYKSAITRCMDDVGMSAVGNTVESEGQVVWIRGYIPVSEEQGFRDAAKANCWAYAIDDVADDDEDVPTRVRYNKVSALMKPVFGILGTVPGYREYDISSWFLMFFSLFFAMIIGDAGYGLCFLAVAVALNIRQKKATDVVLLLYVLSISTIAWGSVTGTWFGFEEAMDIPFLRSLVIPQIANYPELFGISASSAQNTVMKFCFMVGTVQLSLACVMNVIRKMRERHLGWIADIGWFCSINALYMLVMFLVIGEQVDIKKVAIFIAGGFVSVILFGGMAKDRTFGQGLKAGLGDAFTTFLNTISAFGNVMSYIRLFAVGLASLAIAQSFNNMGKGMGVLGMVIIVVGHALNLVMGVLSVVVHGVRLNLLEFSGQLGMEWSGTSYEPFRKK